VSSASSFSATCAACSSASVALSEPSVPARILRNTWSTFAELPEGLEVGHRVALLDHADQPSGAQAADRPAHRLTRSPGQIGEVLLGQRKVDDDPGGRRVAESIGELREAVCDADGYVGGHEF